MMRHIARAVTTVQSTGVPLWALVVVVIGGTVILVTGLVFGLIFAQRWRRRRQRRRRRRGEGSEYRKRRLVIDGRYRDGSSDGGGRSRCSSSSKSEWGQRARSGSGKLRKKQQQRHHRGRGQEDDEYALAGAGMGGGEYASEGDLGMMHSMSPASPPMAGGRWKWGSRSSLPPVLPQLFMGGKRFSMSLFSVVSIGSRGDRTATGHAQEQDGNGGRQTPQFHLPRRQTSNAWIDEDAIHGPVMSPTASPSRHSRAGGGGSKNKPRSRRGSWRASLAFSDSWPLKSISPTLPRLSHFGSPKPSRADVDDLGIRQPPPAVMDPAPATTTTILHRPGSGSGAAPPLLVYRLQSGSHQHHHHQLRNHAVPNLPAPSGDPGQGYSPPRQLPKPPRQALLAASEEVAGAVSQGRSNSWHSSSGMRTPVGQGQPVAQMRPATSYYYVYEDPTAGVTTPTASGSPSRSAVRVSPGTRGRRVISTDSELSQILKGTERRLQEGVMTGSGASTGTRRSRTSVSPPKRALAASALSRAGSFTTVAGMETNESSATLIGTTSRTPSPPKQPQQGRFHGGGAGLGHARGGSQNSVLSDPDSQLVDLAPGPGPDYYHGLTSPSSPTKSLSGQASRGYQPQLQPQLLRRPSIAISVASSVESALSDIDERYSEDAADETLARSSIGAGYLASGNKTGSGLTRYNNQDDDPFVSLPSSSSSGGERAARGRTLPVPPPSRVAHAFNDAPRLQGGPPNRSDITVHALRSESPLSTISGNSASPDLRPRALTISHEKKSPVVVLKTQVPPQQQQQQQQQHQSQRGGKVGTVYAPVAPTSAVSSSSNLHKRQLSIVPDIEIDNDDGDDDEYQNAMTVPGLSVPGLSLTSPSEKGKDSPAPQTATDMRARPSSPTLGRSREKTPDMLPPSPALPRHTPRLSSLYEFYSDPSADARSTSSAGGAHRRAAGEVRRISDDSAASSRYSDMERLRASILREAASREALLWRNSGSSSVGAGAGMGAGTGTGTAQAFQTLRLVQPEDVPTAGLPSTVAQLRRMNSQASSTYYSDGSANNSPVLPTLREEGTGRFVSPPRKREAARNYLSLGNNMPSSAGKASDAGGRYSAGDHNNKENERAGGPEAKTARADVGDNSVLKSGPARKFEASTKGLAGQSTESLGLYDAEGFLISPERRRTHR